MKTSLLLAKLDKVRQSAPDRWTALCPAHEDKTPSLAIREIEGDRILIHCFGGCSVHEIVAAVGMEISDLFPEKPVNYDGKPTRERRPFSAEDALRCLAFEGQIVRLAAERVLSRQSMSGEDAARLALASQRISTALEVTCLI